MFCVVLCCVVVLLCCCFCLLLFCVVVCCRCVLLLCVVVVLCCCVLLFCCVVVLLCPTPKNPNPKPCLGERAGPSGPHLFWVWRCCGCGCCGCCWFGLPWTTFRRTPPPLDLPPPNRTKFRYFFPLPPPFRSFCVSLGVSSWNFSGVFESQTLKCARMGSWVVV